MNLLAVAGTVGVGAVALRAVAERLRLSRAKHPSLRGHARMSRRVARLVPFYGYDESEFFSSDGAAPEIAEIRRRGFDQLSARLVERAPTTARRSGALESSISDVAFTSAYRVPFQFRDLVHQRLAGGCLLEASEGGRVRDLDGNWSHDLSGSYGVNVFGYDFYKECIDAGVREARELGPVLGPYHPVIEDNVRRLKEISGLDEVSFHMSGTEAVMQAVRLARYHTGKKYLVRFCGAYHGWWDGVLPGVGSSRAARDVYTLKDVDDDSLAVLQSRKDIACVLVNPLQAMHPNEGSAGDAMLVASTRRAAFDRDRYADWLAKLRTVCADRGIVLIFDEVFLGFRVARRGAQEYFGVRADLVTYGKTLGGGLPVGVLCGKSELMKRYREHRPTDVCFARGTFNSHPYVMATMNYFLRKVDTTLRSSYVGLDETWNERARSLNERLESEDLPVRVANMVSVWTTLYTRPSRYNWMLQFYLRAEGLHLSWLGTGRFIFSHDLGDADFQVIEAKFVAAAQAMERDGWWHRAPGLTNRAIKRRVLRELLRAAWFRRRGRSGQATPLAGTTAERLEPSVPSRA